MSNNNMKSIRNYYGLTVKELLAQRVTSILILLAIVLSTMMTAAIGQSAGVLCAMRQQQAITLGGDRYATLIQQTAENLERLQNDRRLDFAGAYITLGSAELSPSLTLGLNEYHEDLASIYPTQARLLEGRLPEGPLEVALPEDVLQILGFDGGPGDSIHLSLAKALRHGVEIEAYEYEGDFTLVGVTASNYLGYAGGIVTGLAGRGTAEVLLPEKYIYYNVDLRTADKGAFQATMAELIRELDIHELDVIYNVPYLEALGIRYDAGEAYENMTGLAAEGFPLMLGAGVLVGGLLLLAAGLVIYNILKIAVTRRIGQYGVLRALGAERGRLYRLVGAQTILLCAAGIPLGLMLGALSAKAILTAATGLLSPEIFLAASSEELNRLIGENSSGKGLFLVISAAVTLGFALLATLPAARYAARVSPTMAMTGSPLKIKRRSRRTRKIRSFEAYYARLNLRRSPGRTAITILSLVMSITVFITLQSSVGLLDTAGAVTGHLGDYALINETAGFAPEELAALEAREDVTAVAALQLSLYNIDENARPVGIETELSMHPGETFQVAGLNRVYMEALLGDKISGEELARLAAGEGCIIRNPLPLVFDGEEIPRTEVPAGSTVKVAGRDIPVLATLDGYDTYITVANGGFFNGVQVIVAPELYTRLTGETGFQELKPLLAPGADRSGFDQAVAAFTGRIPGATYVSYEELDRQSAESFAQIRLLAWGLILFVSLIGLLNIANTVYTNIHTRVTEIGIQRAIGMSAGSLFRMFLWEGAYLGIIASALGGLAGYICANLAEAMVTEAIRLTAPPLILITEAALLAIGSCLIATCIPLLRIHKMNIVDAIENTE